MWKMPFGRHGLHVPESRLPTSAVRGVMQNVTTGAILEAR
jgi:hypothetical protein